jgi:hypothetical protein
VLGGLDDSKILEEEAAKADVVVHTADASDHEGAAQALTKGLASGHSKEKPGFYLHTGGAGILLVNCIPSYKVLTLSGAGKPCATTTN